MINLPKRLEAAKFCKNTLKICRSIKFYQRFVKNFHKIPSWVQFPKFENTACFTTIVRWSSIYKESTVLHCFYGILHIKRGKNGWKIGVFKCLPLFSRKYPISQQQNRKKNCYQKHNILPSILKKKLEVINPLVFNILLFWEERK